MHDVLKQKLNNINTIKAPAENTTLADKSIDLITVAQAFHWFDEVAFKAECQRILTDNGNLAIIWNERCDCELARERNQICQKYCGTFHSGHTGKRDENDGRLFLQNEYFATVEVLEYNNNI